MVARIIRPQVVGIAASRGCRRRRHRRRRRRHWGVASRRVSRWDARRVGARARSSSNNNYIKNVCKCMKEINLDSWFTIPGELDIFTERLNQRSRIITMSKMSTVHGR